MRIGITTFGGDGGKSGISQYIINLLREFENAPADLKFEALVYQDEISIFLQPGSRITAVPFGPRLRNPILNVAWHQCALGHWCRARRYDVLFLTAANRRLPVSVPCPSVGTVHDFSSIHVSGKYDPARMFYIKHVLPFLIRRLDWVLTVSKCSKRDIVEYAGVPEQLVVVTPLAADRSLYYPRDQHECARRVHQKYGIRAPYILFVSRIEHPGKNHARLIRAFAQVVKKSRVPHQLVLAGSDWMRAEEVHAEAVSSGLGDQVLFTGFVATPDLPDLYCGSDLFIFPSLYEGFGLPVLEAMSCGIPVACSNLSSMPEVGGEAAVLFDPYNEGAIAEAITELLSDAEGRRRRASLSLARNREFDWGKTAAATMDVLRRAAAAS